MIKVKTEEKVDSVLNLASKLSLNTALSEIDPSRANGFKVVYNRECPFEIRSQEGHVQSIGDVDLFRCKLLVKVALILTIQRRIANLFTGERNIIGSFSL